jgi:hypothetical protein
MTIPPPSFWTTKWGKGWESATILILDSINKPAGAASLG